MEKLGKVVVGAANAGTALPEVGDESFMKEAFKYDGAGQGYKRHQVHKRKGSFDGFLTGRSTKNFHLDKNMIFIPKYRSGEEFTCEK